MSSKPLHWERAYVHLADGSGYFENCVTPTDLAKMAAPGTVGIADINGEGRPYSVTKGNLTTTYNAYDKMGRVTRKTVSIDGRNYVFYYAYDAAGNLTRITYPDDYTVNYNYHKDTNLISSVSAADPEVSVSLSDYSNFGRPGRIHYPAFTTNIHYFTRTGRVDAISVPGLMNLKYTYSPAGDVISLSDSIRNFSYTYGYDNLHRLTSVGGPGPFRQQACHVIDLYYETYEPHAVSRVVVNGEEHDLYYENNGNLTNGYDFSTSGQFPERRLDYNAENMPLTIDYEPQGGSVTTTSLTYDGDDRRVKKQTGADLVIYVDNTYEIRNGQIVKYIFAGDQRLAQITGSAVQYYHKDHLGSSTVMTNADGLQIEATEYLPYGLERTRPGLQKTSYKFTDQELDIETGLYNYDARLYDPVIGRLISPDSIIIANKIDTILNGRAPMGRTGVCSYWRVTAGLGCKHQGAGGICVGLYIVALSDGILPLRLKWIKFCLIRAQYVAMHQIMPAPLLELARSRVGGDY
jgi:RHS repeat-associated protein